MVARALPAARNPLILSTTEVPWRTRVYRMPVAGVAGLQFTHAQNVCFPLQRLSGSG
jgi:hypothetical protein